jgi:hypothetical protein
MLLRAAGAPDGGVTSLSKMNKPDTTKLGATDCKTGRSA